MTFNDKRFGPETNDEDVNRLIDDQKSVNTQRNTKWAESWRQTRNKTGHEIPALCGMTVGQMDTYLCRFVIEVRKRNGDKYPPNSLYHIMCGLLRKLRDDNIHNMNFLDQSDSRFAHLRRAIDSQMKLLIREGLALPQREAQPVAEEEENKIWETGVFGESDATSLQRTVFFYNCKLFGLRAADEHRELTTDQFSDGMDENGEYIEFHGKTNKTYSGSLRQRKIQPKVIRHHDRGSGIVHLYKLYLSSLKDDSENREFYKRPLPRVGENKIRFGESVVGINKLRTFMKNICAAAGLKGRYTNHSGKKTCATSLYQKGVPEQEIMRRTGHRSLAGLRKYQKPSNEMLCGVSDVLNPKIPVLKDNSNIFAPKEKSEILSKCDFNETSQKLETVADSKITMGKVDGKYSFYNCKFEVGNM